MIAHTEDGAAGGARAAAPLTRRSVIGGVVGAGLLAMSGPADARTWADGPHGSGRRPAAGAVAAAPGAAGPQVYTRAQWNAKPPRRPSTVLKRAPDRIIVHHTDTVNSEDRSLTHAFALSRYIQEFHMRKNGWDDTGQQLTISRGGVVMEGRNQSLKAIHAGRLAKGAQVLHHNEHTLGIENEGTYMTAEVPGVLWDSLVGVCVWLCLEYDLDPVEAIVGHRDYNDTSCPGDVLYARLPELRETVAGLLDEAKTAPPTPKPRPMHELDDLPPFPSIDDFR